MSLEQILRVAVDHIRSGSLENEAQVKQAIILPILRASIGTTPTRPNSNRNSPLTMDGLITPCYQKAEDRWSSSKQKGLVVSTSQERSSCSDMQ